MQIKEILELVKDEVRGAWRFRWLGLGVAWALCLIGWFAVYTVPDTYEANARVYVDSRSILRPLLKGLAIDPDVASGLDLVRQVLLSRPQIEEVARSAGFDAAARTPQEHQELISDIQSRIAISAADLRARTTQGEGTYLISFRDHSRDKSIEVVQKMLDSFKDNALGEKRSGQESALSFIEEQIAIYEARLQAKEQRLAEFKKRNVAVMPGSQGDYYTRLQTESAGLDTARTSLSIAQSRRAEIQRQLNGEEPFLFGIDAGSTSAAFASAGAGDLTYRIQVMEKTLEDLRVKYTDKHPEVIATREAIENLKKQQAEELARVNRGQAANGSLSSSLKTNPLYQNLQTDLNRTDVQIAELRKEVEQREARVNDLRSKVNTVPQIEAELSDLNRNYQVEQQKYQELVQRRETALLSEGADRSGTVKFQTIEPPAAAFEPIWPNRPRFMTLVLIAALGAGGGITWLLNQLRPVFHSVRMLEGITGLTVLAAVGRSWLVRNRKSRRLEILKFSAVALLLVLAFGVATVLQDSGAQFVQSLGGETS